MNRDEDGSVIDAIFAVQYIDKEKKKELEYSRALKRALENQNEIYAEMLRYAGLRSHCLPDGQRRNNDDERRGAGASESPERARNSATY